MLLPFLSPSHILQIISPFHLCVHHIIHTFLKNQTYRTHKQGLTCWLGLSKLQPTSLTQLKVNKSTQVESSKSTKGKQNNGNKKGMKDWGNPFRNKHSLLNHVPPSLVRVKTTLSSLSWKEFDHKFLKPFLMELELRKTLRFPHMRCSSIFSQVISPSFGQTIFLF